MIDENNHMEALARSMIAEREAKELQIFSLYNFILSRAKVEAECNPHFKRIDGKPIFSDEMRKAYKEILPRIKSFYYDKGRLLDERELFIAIERLFGKEITEAACLPLGLHSGGCIILALEMIKADIQVDSDDQVRTIDKAIQSIKDNATMNIPENIISHQQNQV